MRTKLSYAASALLSFLLCAVMLCGAVFPSSAAPRDLPSLDYSNPNIESVASLSAYDLYKVLLERTPTEGETLYWKAHELTLTYTNFIPDSCIDTQYNGDLGVLNIIVSSYTYEAANGTLVTWTPESFYLEGKQYSLREENGVYVAQIDNCFHSGDFDMQVEYGCALTIAESVIQTLLDEAYEKGNSALSEMNVYRKKLQEYNELVAEHNAYNAYIKWEEDYANYLVQKALYDELKAAYDAYMAEYNAYLTVLDAYNQWQNYFAQEKAYAANEKPYAEYMDYYKVYSAAVNKLAMFNSIFKKDSHGWNMYADITGSAVTEVLSKQDLLVTSGCNPDDIYLAGEATENLRVLLKGYNDIRTAKGKSDYEKNKALYKYYTDHYDAIEKNFCDLYRTLKGLYENTVVSQFIGMKGKSAHYRQLVGHLFVISTALDQDGYRNESVWRIDKKTLREVIEDVHYFPDGDWDPKNTPYPAVEVPYVERIEKPVRPTVEQPTVEPDAPPVVANPGAAPTVVQNPANTPCPPKPDQEIGAEPVRPVFNEAIDVLYQEVESGKLKQNSQATSAKSLKLTNMVERKISIQNLKTVTFYNADGTPHKQESVHYGGKVKCEDLNRAATAEYIYEFLGWNYADGSAVNSEWITVTENISLYPRYRLTKQMYTVTWILDGQSYTQSLYYGVTPVPELVVDTSPRESQYYYYEFSGWDHQVAPVTGNTTYVGSMLRIPKKFNVTWVIKNGEESITQQWEYNQTPVFEGDLSLSTPTHLYEFLAWDKTVAPVSRDITYTAIYREIPLASGGSDVMNVLHGDTEITVLATKPAISAGTAALLAAKEGKALTIRWEDVLSVSLAGEELQAYINCGAPTMILQTSETDGVMTYDLKYFNVGVNASVMPQATISFAYSKANGQETVFDLQTENGWERIDGAQIMMQGNFKVRRVYSYSIVPTVNEHCNVTQMVKQATAGELISIALDCVYGYKVIGATIVTANGETITVTGTSFEMPASPITISLQVEQIVYTVTFIVDGEIWDYAKYNAGDEIILPADPTKPEADGYVYTFIGWGNVPAIAMGEVEDLVFEASFTKSQTVSDYDTGNNNDVMMTIVLPCVIAAVVLLVIFLILRKIVRRRGGWRVASAKFGAACRRFFGKIGKWIGTLFTRLIDAIKRMINQKKKQ